jgi:prefoldin beta subunit
MAQAVAQRLEEEVKLLRKIQDEAQQTMNTRAQLVAQMKENELVKQELDLIPDEDEGARIYKLIGPVLVKQDKKEAASNVGKRIDFLQVPPAAIIQILFFFLTFYLLNSPPPTQSELQKLEANLEDMQKKQAAKRRFIVEMQTKLQTQPQ